MKKITLLALFIVCAVAVNAQTVSQFVTGNLALQDFGPYIEMKQNITFDGGTVPNNVAVRSDYFRVSDVLSCTASAPQCTVSTTLSSYLLSLTPSTSEEDQLLTDALNKLETDLQCLDDIYTTGGSIGSDTYFNELKLCYVRAIKDLGIISKIFIDEDDAFFAVQMVEEIQEDLQHLLAMEDQNASLAFEVPQAEIGTGVDLTVALAQDGTDLDITIGEDVNNYFEDEFVITVMYFAPMSAGCTPLAAGGFDITASDMTDDTIVCHGRMVGAADMAAPVTETVPVGADFAVIALAKSANADETDFDDNLAYWDIGNTNSNPMADDSVSIPGTALTADDMGFTGAYVTDAGMFAVRQTDLGQFKYDFGCFAAHDGGVISVDDTKGLGSSVSGPDSLFGLDAIYCFSSWGIDDELEGSITGAPFTMDNIAGGVFIVGNDHSIDNDVTLFEFGDPNADPDLALTGTFSGGPVDTFTYTIDETGSGNDVVPVGTKFYIYLVAQGGPPEDLSGIAEASLDSNVVRLDDGVFVGASGTTYEMFAEYQVVSDIDVSSGPVSWLTIDTIASDIATPEDVKGGGCAFFNNGDIDSNFSDNCFEINGLGSAPVDPGFGAGGGLDSLPSSSPTGAVVFDAGNEQGDLVALALAAILVIGIFLYVLRRRA